MKRRSGFTLIELMIVIAIVAVLAALLTPVLASAVRTARQASVQTEIRSLETSIEAFKIHFGDYPPSYFDFRLYAADGSLDPMGTMLKPAMSARLRRMFPDIDMAELISDLQNHPDSQKELDGPACLVYWLGGVVVDDFGQPMGFSGNPRTPFRVDLNQQRIGPFYEFKPERLWDKNPPPPSDPTAFDGYEGYLDPLPGQTTPYMYTERSRYMPQETYNSSLDPADPNSLPMYRPVYKATISTVYKPNTYQIVSPGYDYVYGPSRWYDAKAEEFITQTNPADPSTRIVVDGGTSNDNITNFGNGPLVD